MKYWDTLTEAAKIAEERQESYGNIEENFKEISDISKSMFGLEVSEAEICKVMIAVKVARQKHKHKDDNIVDMINYIAILNQFLK